MSQTPSKIEPVKILKSLQIVLIAIFVTATVRLAPLPVSDTVSTTAIAVAIFCLGLFNPRKYNVGYYKAISPIILLLSLTVILDLLLSRFGFETVVFFVKLAGIFVVGRSVYALPINLQKKVVVYSALLLVLQFVLFNLSPDFFASAGRRIGIEDPFTMWNREQDRVYLAYFQANVAAYSFFFFLLTTFILWAASELGAKTFLTLCLVFSTLVVLSGSRGALILMMIFYLGWFLLRYNSFIFGFGLLIPIVIIFYPFAERKLMALILLREDSNIERSDAIRAYFGYIYEHPIFGIGYQVLRDYVYLHNNKPSHVLFIEIIAAYGIPLGGSIIFSMCWILIAKRPVRFAWIGIFAILPGLFSNSILLNLSFFPLVVAMAVTAQRRIGSDDITAPRQHRCAKVSL